MQGLDKTITNCLSRLDPDGSRYLFNGICRNWEEIVGSETAELVKPLGRKQSTLVLGALDSIVIQEVSFFSEQILEMVNAFCGSEFFDKVRVELLQGRTPLDRELVKKPETGLPIRKPSGLGGLKDKMRRDSPVARCYDRYVEFFRAGSTQEKD